MQDKSRQYGAPSRETCGNDMWAFLGQPPPAFSAKIRACLNELTVEHSALTVLDSKDLLLTFKNLSGYVAEGLPNLNPFIMEMDSGIHEFCCNRQKLSDQSSKAEIECFIREILVIRCDSVRSVIIVLSLSNFQLGSRIKRLLISSLEKNAKDWGCWKNYSGVEPGMLDKEQASRDFNAFWDACNGFFDGVIECIKQYALEVETSNEDIETMLRRWRDVPAYFRECSSWEEVFLREKVIFDSIELKLTIEWRVRQKHLMKLLVREEMNVESLVNLRAIELSEAAEYEQWLVYVKQVFNIAINQGKGKYSSQPSPRYEQRQKHSSHVMNPVRGEKKSEKWCSFCKTAGHLVSECQNPEFRKKKQTGGCFICGDSSHWANQCPKKSTVQQGQQSANPVPKSQAPTPRPSSSVPVNPISVKHPQPPPVQQMPAQSRYGRPFKPTKPFSLNTIGEPIESEKDDVPSDSLPKMIPGGQCNRTIAPSSQPDVPMPSVKVIVENCRETFQGLLDTGSNLSFLSRPAFEKIRMESGASEKTVSGFNVETVNGVEFLEERKIADLTLAVEDSTGERSAFMCKSVLIFEGESIPGGYDFLLSSEIILNHNLDIKGKNLGYEILLPKSPFVNASTSTSECSVVLNSIRFDAPEIEDDHDLVEDIGEMANIVESLPSKSISMGPLSEDELEFIKERIHDPPLQLCFDQSKIDPPVYELGFPAPMERQLKLFDLLRTLEDRKIIRRVPKGSGRYVSPGYGVRKNGDRVRLVVKYCSLNSRLKPPMGVRYHNPVEWVHDLPAWAKYYSVLDVRDAFYRIAVHEDSRPYLNMSIWSPEGCFEYEWLKMPQGLSSSPSFWCALIESTVSSILRFVESSEKYRDLLLSVRVLVYVDDVLIAAKDQRSCSLMTDIVFQAMSFNGMYLPENKTQRTKEVVEVMGLKLINGCIHPNDETVQKIHNLKRPTNRQELLGVLGLLNYVRRSIPSRSAETSELLGRLYDLANSHGKYSWKSSHEEAWDSLVLNFKEGLPIDCFSLIPGVENINDWTLVIQTDASSEYIGFGVFLIPRVSDRLLDEPSLIDVCEHRDTMKIINVGSKRLQHRERLYVAHDREALGIFWALHVNRKLIYLFGEVVLQTDNRTSLSRFTRLPSDEASTTRGRRWIRWISDLSDILFCRSRGGRDGLVRFCHLKGQNNNFADFLSRFVMSDIKLCEVQTQTETISGSVVLATSVNAIKNHVDSDNVNVGLDPTAEIRSQFSDTVSSLLKNWDCDDSSEYIKSIKLRHIHAFLANEELDVSPARKRVIQQVCRRRFSLLPNKCLQFHNNSVAVLVVPNVQFEDGLPLRVYLIKYCHEDSALSCHRGELATRSQLRRSFWWPSMDRDITHWIKSCIPCVIRKGDRTCGGFNPRKLSSPNQLLLADWIGPLQRSVAGYEYVLVLVDGFSGYCNGLQFRNKSSENTAEGIMNWISLFGVPERWSSDNDSTFVSETIRNVRSLLGIRDEVVPTYSPQTQGSVERAIRTLKEGIETVILQNQDSIIDWPLLLKAVVFNANSIERYGGISPFEVMLGRKPVDPLTAAFGIVDTRLDSSSSQEEYVLKLKEKLKDIHDYWMSKSSEIRNRVSDIECDGMDDLLQANDLCIRVAYNGGRRVVLGIVRVVSKVIDSSNSYNVISVENGKSERVHGYQLMKVLPHPNRRELSIENVLTRPFDPDSNEYFIIEKIIEYDPARGYLVNWSNYPEEDNSWQKPSDMPSSAFRKEMKRARDKFHSAKKQNNGEVTSGGNVVVGSDF